MSMLADMVDVVVGGDTHRDSHTLEIATAQGVPISTITVTNDEAGYARALAFLTEHTTTAGGNAGGNAGNAGAGPRVVVGLEGTRSYGIGLARAFTAAGIPVVEVRPGPAGRGEAAAQGHRGKSDPIDAHRAVLTVLRMNPTRLPRPRSDGDREALRILLNARHDMTTTRTAQINQLRALLLTGDDTDRALARAALTQTRLATLARRRGRTGENTHHTVRRHETRRLALAITATGRDLATNKKHLTNLVQTLAPTLLTKTGIGPVSAAQAIVSWSHPGRCRNEAAFAALAGTAPIPASSGRTTRHRLNRGGDRQLNRALHNITLTRWRCCPRTHAYITRRRNQGLTDPEIRRCLKRYIAREIHRTLTNTWLDNT